MESKESYRDYYRKKIIELTTESKKKITFDTDTLLKFNDINELGNYVNDMVLKKIKECDDHIEYIKSLDD